MTDKYWLVAGTTACNITRCTGLKAWDTPMGALVERPKPFDLKIALDKLNRVMHPHEPRCSCGQHAMIHSPRCPLAVTIT